MQPPSVITWQAGQRTLFLAKLTNPSQEAAPAAI